MRSGLRAFRNWLASGVRRWAQRRQGADPLELTLVSRRIYIVPTRAGVMYGAMLATMLAGSMNYNNNLAFALTFLLAGVAIVTIYHTHRNLCGLSLHYLGAEPVHAGDDLAVRISLVNASYHARDEIVICWTDSPQATAALSARESRTVSLELKTQRRGPLPLPALRLHTHAPLGLVRAWTWVYFEVRPLVYPRAAPAARQFQSSFADAAGREAPRAGDDDFRGLRAYQPGDPLRRIAWKTYARTGHLTVREFHSGDSEQPVWFDWDMLSGDTETRVSLLTRLVLDAYVQGRQWGLRLPGMQIGPARQSGHLHRCLHELALTKLPE